MTTHAFLPAIAATAHALAPSLTAAMPTRGSGLQAEKSPKAALRDPVLINLDPAQLTGFFTPGPGYTVPVPSELPGSLRPVSVRVIGAYEIRMPKLARLIGAVGPGFMPITLKLSDGRCFLLSASYVGERLSGGMLGQTSCPPRPGEPEHWPTSRPADSSMRLIGTSWGYGAWADRKRGLVTVTVPRKFTFEPLFTTPMRVLAFSAINSPDAPIGDMTLVGKINGRMSVVTLEVGW